MNKYEILKDIFDVENIQEKLEKTNQNRVISYLNLLSVLSKSYYTLNKDLGVSASTVTRTLKYLWPERPSTNARVCGYLLKKYGYKHCSNCNTVKEESAFSRNSSRDQGINSHCKECCLYTRRDYQKTYQAQVRAKKLQRTPSWSETVEIIAFYNKCPDGYHVDHIIPLQGKLVSGLHVLSNLQYLPAEENLSKNNKFQI